MRFARTLCFMLAAAALALGGCASGTAGRRSGHYIDDATLTAQVRTAIATDVGPAAAAGVGVQADRGRVRLSGAVDSQDQKERAAEAARDVGGVRLVENDLRVRSSAGSAGYGASAPRR